MTLLIQSLTVTLIVPAITLIATFIHSFAGRRGTIHYSIWAADDRHYKYAMTPHILSS
ncbi:hypothetical protein [Hominilimicola sp.]|uniref:hypothetical protein n=1 Tax=Hominilimicola sp. TaxID=3073571 RepID=UPI003999BEE1